MMTELLSTEAPLPSTSDSVSASTKEPGVSKSASDKDASDPSIPEETSASTLECPACSLTFTRIHNLKSHLLTHSRDKPFTCDTCSSKFRRLHDLKRHLKLHTGERPYVCDKCGRRFARGDALIRHTKGAGTCAVPFGTAAAEVSSTITSSASIYKKWMPSKQSFVDDNSTDSSEYGVPLVLPPSLGTLSQPPQNNSSSLAGQPQSQPQTTSNSFDQQHQPPRQSSLDSQQQAEVNNTQQLNPRSNSSSSASISNEQPPTPLSRLSFSDPSRSLDKSSSTISLPPISSSIQRSSQSNYFATTVTPYSNNSSTGYSNSPHNGGPSLRPPTTQSPTPSSSFNNENADNQMRAPSISRNNSTSVSSMQQQHSDDPWVFIRILESRIRALEERVHVAEGRLTYIENPSNPH